MHRKLRIPLLLAGLLLLAPLAAQAANGGIYAAFSTTSLSTSGSSRFNGGTLGGYAEVNLKHSFDFLNVGGDARFSIEHANQSGVSESYDTYMVGPEISFKTHITPLRPYAEFLFGGAHVSASASLYGITASDSQSYGAVNYIAGADVTLVPHLAWRLLELNYAKFNGISSTTFSTGLVLRLP
jgi:hypothetical protein